MTTRIISSGELAELAFGSKMDVVDGVKVCGDRLQRLNTVMGLACERNYLELVVELVAAGADQDLNVDYLCLAAGDDSVQLTEYLVSRGVDVDGKSTGTIYPQSFLTPLMVAASGGAVLTFNLLLDCGANVFVVGPDEEETLAMAINSFASRLAMNRDFPQTNQVKYRQIIRRLVQLNEEIGRDVSWTRRYV